LRWLTTNARCSVPQAWDLLAKLPTNAAMEASIASFHTAAQAPEWSELIDPTSAFSLLYALRIVKAALQRDRVTVRTNVAHFFHVALR
jgi:hypothetical protein